MEFERTSGILLHPTSLPGRFGIGDLGAGAYRFVDFLAGSGQQLWQVMPLGPTSYGDSPYQALSAFAGNPLLISLDRLAEQGTLAPWDLGDAPYFPPDRVDYPAVIDFKSRLLRLSFRNYLTNAGAAETEDLAAFNAANRSWLDDFALYVALKEAHRGASWNAWERDIATRQPAAMKRWSEALAEEVEYHKYVQFQFYRQWSALKVYANERGIRIIGDIPIFVSLDSADAWAHPGEFYFDEAGSPTVVAGVPPDFFSPTGQRWGNPLYRWDRVAANGYEWWIERFRMMLRMVDIVRIDHFRGFQSYYAVPAEEETAENGEWLEGPGVDLFRAVEKALGPLPIIAEDLGLITPEVEELLDVLGCPGMKVLQFAFGSGPDSKYLPHNYTHNFVVYTGTHDNDTTRGWWDSKSLEERTPVQKYLGRHGDDIAWDLIRLAMMSVADMAVFPLQDVLDMGSEARMNTPGRAEGNWGWRYTGGMLHEGIRDRLRDLTETYGRAPRVEEEEEGQEVS